jgi:hypothetical protein
MIPRLLTAATMAAALTLSPVFADTAPLPAGKPAGTRQADLIGVTPWVGLIFLGALAAGIFVAATSGGKTQSAPGTGH